MQADDDVADDAQSSGSDDGLEIGEDKEGEREAEEKGDQDMPSVPASPAKTPDLEDPTQPGLQQPSAKVSSVTLVGCKSRRPAFPDAVNDALSERMSSSWSAGLPADSQASCQRCKSMKAYSWGHVFCWPDLCPQGALDKIWKRGRKDREVEELSI